MKRAFSLIELIIAVALMAIIAIFLNYALANFKSSQKKIAQKELTKTNRYKIKELLYLDLMQMSELKIYYGKINDVVFLRTKNSLFNNVEPFVNYVVVKKNKTLLRIESQKPITHPINEFDLTNIGYNIIVQDVENFRFTMPKNGKETLLVWLFAKKLSPIVFELPIINDIKLEIFGKR